MSVVVYHRVSGTVAADSIAVSGDSRMQCQKVFPYRDAKGAKGVLGFTGHAPVAMEHLHAYLDGGAAGFTASVKEWRGEYNQGYSVIIVPAEGDLMYTAGTDEPLFPTAKQNFAIGHYLAVNRARDKMMTESFHDASDIVDRAITYSQWDTEVYLARPVRCIRLDWQPDQPSNALDNLFIR